MLCVVIFSVFMVLFPKGGMLRFYLEPARSKGRCLGYEAIAAGALATKLFCRCLDYEAIAALGYEAIAAVALATKLSSIVDRRYRHCTFPRCNCNVSAQYAWRIISRASLSCAVALHDVNRVIFVLQTDARASCAALF